MQKGHAQVVDPNVHELAFLGTAFLAGRDLQLIARLRKTTTCQLSMFLYHFHKVLGRPVAKGGSFGCTHSYIALRRFWTSCIWSIALSVKRFASLPCESTLTSCRMTLYSPRQGDIWISIASKQTRRYLARCDAFGDRQSSLERHNSRRICSQSAKSAQP